MKKAYVKPEIRLFDIRMEDAVASTCISYVTMNFSGRYCYSTIYGLIEGVSRPFEDCQYSVIENS